MQAEQSRFRIDWSLVIFVLSLCGLAFLYGVISTNYKLFPYRATHKAMEGFDAWMALEDETLGASVNRIDEKASTKPIFRTLATGAGNELLLVTGGPNQDAVRCPKFGCLAWIIDRQGKVLHSWPLPLDALMAGVKSFKGNPDLRNFYPIGLHLLPDGGLVATIRARNTYPYVVGIARVDWNGKLLWHHIDSAHHWVSVGADGRIYAPIQIRHKRTHIGGNAVPIRCPVVTYDEGVRIYRPDGSIERTLLMSDLLVRNNYPGLIYSVRDDCDPIHLNSVDVLTPAVAAHIPGSAPGDILVSIRELSAVALVDPVSGTIRRLVAGRSAAQHSAHFLPDGTVLVFDNQGGEMAKGGSRILRINLVDGTARTVFPTAASHDALPFYSSDGGTVTPSPDGARAMISSKDESRDLEFDIATGQPLWTTTRVMDVGPFMNNDGKPIAGYFKAYGTYYITDEQARALHLR